MMRSRRPWRPLPEALLLLALGSGCVSAGTHGEVVSERDALAVEVARLEEQVRRLEASGRSLDAERVKLIDEMEDLRLAQQELARDVRQLRKTEAELSTSLEQRTAELEARRAEIEKMRSTYEGLVSDLEKELADGQIEIEQLREGLQLNMAQEVLFASGSSTVGRHGAEVLGKVAERVANMPYSVVVQGHTDNVPISSQRFPTNWELAGARAAHVVRILQDRGVDPGRLSAVSFGEHAPRAPNDDAEGRARNRRIEITLKPLAGADALAAAGAEAGAEEQDAAAPAP